MIAVIGLIIGIVLGVLLDPTVPAWLAPFLPVAVVAGLDALFGAGRLPSCLPGHPAWCRLSDDDSCRRRSGYPYLLQHGVDSPSSPESLR